MSSNQLPGESSILSGNPSKPSMSHVPFTTSTLQHQNSAPIQKPSADIDMLDSAGNYNHAAALSTHEIARAAEDYSTGFAKVHHHNVHLNGSRENPATLSVSLPSIDHLTAHSSCTFPSTFLAAEQSGLHHQPMIAAAAESSRIIHHQHHQEKQLPGTEKQLLGTEKQDSLAVAQEEFACQWDECDAPAFKEKRDLILHLNEHVDQLQWKVRNSSYSYQCLWQKCWNKTMFANASKMNEHLRAHTLEKPFICPVKACRMAFAIKSNCLFHSKCRHGRQVKPIFFDIIKNEEVVEPDTSVSYEGNRNSADAERGDLGGDADWADDSVPVTTSYQRKRKQTTIFTYPNTSTDSAATSAAKRARSSRAVTTSAEAYQKSASNKRSFQSTYTNVVEEGDGSDYLACLDRYESWLAYTRKEMESCKARLHVLLDVLVANQPASVSKEGSNIAAEYEKGYVDLEDHLESSRGVLEETRGMVIKGMMV